MKGYHPYRPFPRLGDFCICTFVPARRFQSRLGLRLDNYSRLRDTASWVPQAAKRAQPTLSFLFSWEPPQPYIHKQQSEGPGKAQKCDRVMFDVCLVISSFMRFSRGLSAVSFITNLIRILSSPLMMCARNRLVMLNKGFFDVDEHPERILDWFY